MKDTEHTAMNFASPARERDYAEDNNKEKDCIFADIEKHWAKDYIMELIGREIIHKTKDALFYPDDKITTEQFVNLVIKSCKGSMWPENDSPAYMDYALHKGIIEDYDMVNRSSPVKRRRVARIVHEALISELSEKDEGDWSAAERLLDLYSCHSCVIHIAQVYVKGIMPGREEKLFDPEGNISRAEAAQVIVRMLDKQKRLPKMGGKAYKCQMLSPDEAYKLMADNKRAMLIDVRSRKEYGQGHITGSICIPLHDIAINPYMVCERKDIPIILYCQSGYKSFSAAQILIDAGYTNICTIPGIEQYDYSLVS